jgi:hypothetical protein
VYAQRGKASDALNDAFSPVMPDDEVLFQLPVTQTWLRQVTLGLTLICRSSYRGVMEFMRDLLGVSVSVGRVHDVLHWAAQQAGVINRGQVLSGIRVGVHDEIFQGATSVLAGVDAQSTYCYLLAAERHRDADTWGVHLLEASRQGLAPEYTIADAGQGLRAGQKAAWGDTPCHGDVFHYKGSPSSASPIEVVCCCEVALPWAREKVKDCDTTNGHVGLMARTLMKDARGDLIHPSGSNPRGTHRYAPRRSNPLHIIAGSAK